jgi:hypothetical protein
MNPNPSRSAALSDAALDSLFAGSGERLLAAYLRNALHTISPGTVAYWSSVIGEAMQAEAARYADDPDTRGDYASLIDALQIDAASLSSRR